MPDDGRMAESAPDSSPLFEKERANPVPALTRQHTGDHGHFVIERWMIPDALGRLDRACARLGGPIDERGHTRMDHRANTHQTGLNGDIENRAGKTIVANRTRRITQRNNLGMGSGIVRGNRLVVTAPDDPVPIHNHRTHRNFPGICGHRRLCQGFAHERNVRRHSRLPDHAREKR